MDSAELNRAIKGNFNKDEIKTLCFELNIEFENLDATTQAGLARELFSLLFAGSKLALQE